MLALFVYKTEVCSTFTCSASKQSLCRMDNLFQLCLQSKQSCPFLSKNRWTLLYSIQPVSPCPLWAKATLFVFNRQGIYGFFVYQTKACLTVNFLSRQTAKLVIVLQVSSSKFCSTQRKGYSPVKRSHQLMKIHFVLASIQ